ncbi:hypothetical protein [Candidatus Nitrosocosmicus arcticus]|uniref:Uncharacterized protein n=1 Tax=Candidatus Nitrosocosmicus arcticus TaxID=2035267 RepID=A0A557SWK9_9ARCH|nr:hypothetical protein [Candidatus Nitrosocosmicus arcticus]TVP40997.1 conserved membrane protein of unknown function [Candidatus Nitrosocosmicus arcticus]
MNYAFILLTVALGLLLLSLLIPWIITNIFGQRAYTLLDVTTILLNNQITEENTPANNSSKIRMDPVLSDLSSNVYPNSSLALFFSLILYPISIIILIASIVVAGFDKFKKGKFKIFGGWSKVALIAGILVVVASVSWIYSLQSFKTQFSEHAELAGGIIGEEWKGNASVVIDRMIVMGFGPFVGIISGIIGIFVYFVEKTYRYQG